MAHVADHRSVEELEQRYRACEDACEARHYHAIWLLAQGHTIVEVSALTSFVPRWIEQPGPLQRAGAARAGDLRRNNSTRPSALTPELLGQLKDHVRGVRTARGGKWAATQVRDILRRVPQP
jgi:hypothetical protein